MYKLAPSLLAADFSRLGEELRTVADAGAEYIHIDVMDGHFVPSITIGPLVVKALRPLCDIVFDVHLMVSKPERHIAAFADAGADIISFHTEASENPRECLRLIREAGKRAAIAIKPATPVESLYDYIGELDMALIMSVEPGKGGQTLIEETLKKSEQLAGFLANNRLSMDIEMDGGIYLSNISQVLSAGVNVVVAGSAVFGSDPAASVKAFHRVFNGL